MSRQPLYEQARQERTNQHWRPECKEIIQLLKEIHPGTPSQCITHAEEIGELQQVQWNKHLTFRFLSKLYLNNSDFLVPQYKARDFFFSPEDLEALLYEVLEIPPSV